FENLIQVLGGTPFYDKRVRPIANEAAGFHELPCFIDRWQAPLGREVDDSLAVLACKGVHESQQCVDPAALDPRKGRIKVDQIMHANGVDAHAKLGRRILRFTSAEHHALLVSFQSMATSDVLGAISKRISSRLVLSSVASNEMPVAFPPGRARLGTTPAPTGSPTYTKMIGIVVVAFRPAMAAGVLNVMIASTFKLPNSAASSVSRSTFPSAHRVSRIMSRPSV